MTDQFADRQRRGLDDLMALARKTSNQQRGLDNLMALARKASNESVSIRPHRNMRMVGRHHGNIRPSVQVPLASRKRTVGALADYYDIPTATLRRRHVKWLVIGALLITAAALARHLYFLALTYRSYRLLMVIWTLSLAFITAQWVLSWRDRPWIVRPAQQRRLDSLRVVVNIPLYNEDPALMDRCLWALVNQSRPPQRIDVVDDGSTTDYSGLREHWQGWHGSTEVSWTRQRNGGKKHAQVATFRSDEAANIFVTIDSDTCLEHNALEEGLKPFARRDVMSVAGVALALNSNVSWLTRTVSARDLFFQLVARGTQSSFGDVLVNSGAFALYRAEIIRQIIPAYVNETFFGHRVKLGDDATLTLFARGAGRAVQQPTAFAFTMNPEKLSHHFRQWIRWMRGATIRNCWRIRYLPVLSWGWLSVVLGIYSFMTSLAVPVLIVVQWPATAKFAEEALVAMTIWSYLTALRIIAVRRSDENWAYRFGTWLSYMPGAIWGLVLLRPLRLYGLATCLRQGWTTRVEGAEVLATPRREGQLT
jgi:hyaluronan synthase